MCMSFINFLLYYSRNKVLQVLLIALELMQFELWIYHIKQTYIWKDYQKYMPELKRRQRHLCCNSNIMASQLL